VAGAGGNAAALLARLLEEARRARSKAALARGISADVALATPATAAARAAERTFARRSGKNVRLTNKSA